MGGRRARSGVCRKGIGYESSCVADRIRAETASTSQSSLQNIWDIHAVVSSAFRYCAGSLCFMTAGTNLTALMKGMSSLTAQLEIQAVLGNVLLEAQTSSHIPMNLPNTNRQSQ